MESGPTRATRLLDAIARNVSLARDGQSLRLDADPDAWIDCDPGCAACFVALVELASRTAPPGCELLLAAARPPGRVAAVGEGEIVIRWQLANAPLAPGENALDAPGANALDAPGANARSGTVVPIRPLPGSASELIASYEARRLVDAFDEHGFALELEALDGGRELIARAGNAGR